MGQRLGQHFLINAEKLKKVADALEINEGDIVIEIGPGHGELTQYLLKAGAQVTALERDTALIEPLKKKFVRNDIQKEGNGKRGSFWVVEGNALETLPKVIESFAKASGCHSERSEAESRDLQIPRRARDDNLCNVNFKIVGNIPYYITGHLLRVIEALEHKPTRVVLTIQKEVAERICAQPPQMNLLAASVQFWADSVIVGIVPKKDFNPPPKVDSATIRLDVHSAEGDSTQYYAFIRKLFTQPRKTILNNLVDKEGDKKAVGEILKAVDVSPNTRPQMLSVETIMKLAKLFSSSGMV